MTNVTSDLTSLNSLAPLTSFSAHSLPIESFNRHYRPQFFRDVIGQDHVVSFLSRGFLQHKIPQSLLFSGSHGLGKTTLARLTAKILCCLHPVGSEPCHNCSSCVCFHGDKNLFHSDVTEWDGASYTSVDDIRPMIETCAYAPMMSKAKVFILDEVHMLSRSAFNALLKIIEEPPAHVYFFFATTQRDKIPATILSRCHDLVLRPVGLSLLEDYLKKIHRDQGLGELDALIARSLSLHSKGSVRDAVKFLEHHLLFPQEFPSMDKLWTSILKKRNKEALGDLEELLGQGLSPEDILEELMVLVYQHQETLLLQQGKEKGEREVQGSLEPQKNETPKLQSLLSMDLLWQVLQKGYHQLKKSPFPSLCLKLLITRLSYIQDIHLFDTPDLSKESSQESPLRQFSPKKQQEPKDQDNTKIPSSPLQRQNISQKTSFANQDSAQKTSFSAQNSSQKVSCSDQSSSQKTSSLSSSIQSSSENFSPNVIEEVFFPECFPPKNHDIKPLMALAEEKRQGLLCAHLYQHLVLVKKEETSSSTGSFVFHWRPKNFPQPPHLESSLKTLLEGYEGKTWTIIFTPQAEGFTLQEDEKEDKKNLYEKIVNLPFLKNLKQQFPALELKKIEPLPRT